MGHFAFSLGVNEAQKIVFDQRTQPQARLTLLLWSEGQILRILSLSFASASKPRTHVVGMDTSYRGLWSESGGLMHAYHVS